MTPTPLILDADAVRALLPRLDVMEELRSLFRQLGQGRAVQPAQTITDFPDSRGDFITYLGVLADAGVFGAKLSPYIVTGAKPVITAWTNLMSMKTGLPLLWCDAGLLTTERTAGTTALAVDLLARPDAGILTIIGTGAIAQAHFRHVAGLRNWSEVRVFSLGLAGDTGRQSAWRALCPGVRFMGSAGQAVAGADVAMLCTSSGTPVIEPEDIGKPALITSISTNAANAHEVPPAFLSAADVYCDYAATTPRAAGEMKLASRDHGWNADRVLGDLPGLVCETCQRPTYDKPVFFRSIGLGLEDIAMAHGLWQLVKSA